MLRLKLARAIGVTGITLSIYAMVAQIYFGIKLNNWRDKVSEGKRLRLEKKHAQRFPVSRASDGRKVEEPLRRPQTLHPTGSEVSGHRVSVHV